MAILNYDVLRLEGGGSTGLAGILRNRQTGYENVGTYRQGHMRADGNMNWWTPDGQIQATGIGYTHGSYPAVGVVSEMLDSLATAVTGISAGAIGATGAQGTAGAQGATGLQGTVGSQGVTGLQGTVGAAGVTGLQGSQGDTGLSGVPGYTGASNNFIARVNAAGTQLFNSGFHETGTNIVLYNGDKIIVNRVINTSGGYPAQIELHKEDSACVIGDYVGRILLTGTNDAGGAQTYGMIDAVVVNPSAAAYDMGIVKIYVGDNGGVSEEFRVTRDAGCQAYNSSFAVVDSSLGWDEDQRIAFSIETGAQGSNTAYSEGGAAVTIEKIGINGAGKISALTKLNAGNNVLDIHSYSANDPTTAGAVTVTASMQNGTGLTGIGNSSKVLKIVNHTTSVADVNGQGDINCAALTCTTLTSNNIGKKVYVPMTAAGFTGAGYQGVTGIVTLLGNGLVNLHIPPFEYPSSSTSLSIGTELYPVYVPIDADIYTLAAIKDAGGAQTMPSVSNYAKLDTSGSITFYHTSSSGFTNDGALKGLYAPINISYRTVL